jgi:outer membrane cobalamin receptor
MFRRCAALGLILAASAISQTKDADSSSVDSLSARDSSALPRITLSDFRSPADTTLPFRVFLHDELMKMYHGDLADLLWNVAGMSILDPGSYGKPISVSFNGLSNRHVLVLLDGQPMNDPDLGWMNLNTISLENIDRIEVYKGSYSGRYGAAASGGIIQIRSKEIPSGYALTSIKFRSVFSSFEDIGAFFGRGIGSRTEIRVGGSSKSTPGEQNVQGFRGGFIRSIQRTRYSGRVIFVGVRHLVMDNFLTDFYLQTSRDQYDAYGRNRFGDSKNLDFSTPEGERKDERSDYRLRLTHRMPWFEHAVTGTIGRIGRTAQGFDDTTLAPTWVVRHGSIDYELSRRWQVHQLKTGVNWYRMESKKTIGRWTSTTWYLQDDFTTRSWSVSTAFQLLQHSEFDAAPAVHAVVSRKIGPHRVWINGGWSKEIPTAVDRWLTRTPNPFGSGPSKIRMPTLLSLSAGFELPELPILHRFSISGYVHRIHDPIYYEPEFFYSDSTQLRLINGRRADVRGLDIEASYRTGFILWTGRQSIMQAPREAHSGVATFTTWLTGIGELKFLNDNLLMTGALQARSVSRHDGLTYQDLPPVYYVTPRRSDGGWIFNTRITATIGSFYIFYEAENILRARFTILDGYDVTPQQVRVGLIWKLYN